MNAPKIRIVQKKFSRRQNSNSNLLINSKNPPKSFELVSGRMVMEERDGLTAELDLEVTSYAPRHRQDPESSEEFQDVADLPVLGLLSPKGD